MKESMKRKKFMIYTKWVETLNSLPEQDQLKAYKGLFDLCLTMEVNKDLPKYIQFVLRCFKSTIEQDYNQYLKNKNNNTENEEDFEELFREFE